MVKMLNGYLFLTAAGGIQGGYNKDVMEKLARIAKQHKVNEIVVESNFGDGMFTELFKPHLQKVDYPVAVKEVRHSIQKERRICDTLEPVMSQHRLVVDKPSSARTTKAHEPTPTNTPTNISSSTRWPGITRERGALSQDDRLDAVAIAVGYWTEQMALDADKLSELRKEELLRKELENWSTSIQGVPFGYDLTCMAGVGIIQSARGASLLGGTQKASGFHLSRR